ncbi:MAG: group I intron-associated PD-(D/E)XK endonuclease [Myxococcota bacterium]|nr:group I intron-associated PD-(D/E)XK endonuclease [Myxococcota bacterium]
MGDAKASERAITVGLAMRVHHTKNKGDLGVLYAKVDLFEKGFLLLMPQTEHAPFDLVAYRDERFFRVQVKYRAAVNGQVSFHLSSSWADRHGVHTNPIDKRAIDLLCIYCPDTRACYYVDPASVKASVRLRISPARNQQVKGVRSAAEFRGIPPSVLGVPAGSSSTLEGEPEVRQSAASTVSVTRP